MIAQDLLGKQTSAGAVGTHNMGIVFAQTLNMFIRNKPLSFLIKKKETVNMKNVFTGSSPF